MVKTVNRVIFHNVKHHIQYLNKEKVLLVAKVSAGGHTGVLEATKAGPAPRRDSRGGGGPRRDSRGGNRRSDPNSRRNSFRNSSNGGEGSSRSYNRD